MALSLTQLQSVAINAAEAGGQILRKYFCKKLRISEKKGAGLVTNADIEAEEKITRILRKKCPDFGFLTEESAPVGLEKEGKWIVDPLDGTTNFIHGFPMFCVSIAAEWKGQVVIGVIYHPILKDTYVAQWKKGSKLNGKPIFVSKTKALKDSLLTTGFTYKKDKWLESEMQAFSKLSHIARAIRRPGSAALDLAYTARGVFDGFWERGLSPWDTAAGTLLVREAGGKVTDFRGNEHQNNFGELLATNSTLHQPFLNVIKSPT